MTVATALSPIRTADDNAALPELGGKAFALAQLRDVNANVPPWFAVTPALFEQVVSGDILARVTTEGTESAAWSTVSIGAADRASLIDHAQRIAGPNSLLAVRSSAIGEDALHASHAGQLESYLGIAPADVPDAVIKVWRSAFAPHVLEYRRNRGLGEQPPIPAVLVQRMVNADAAGVAFSVDPVAGRWAHALVAAVPGLGEGIVQGELDADTYRVDRDDAIVDREIATKSHCVRLTTSGTQREDVAESARTAPVLSDAQVTTIAQLARMCERHFGLPQDIEWAIEAGTLYLLQSRPITTLDRVPDPDGALNIWDNSNIAESYGGVTTPLTYSFARYIYTEVYTQFCLLLGVSRRVVEDHRTVFANMLGLIRGRVYYNLMSWYRMLALLPGFKMNRRFMEQMMGVREAMPADVLASITGGGGGAKLLDALRFVRTLFGLWHASRRLPRWIKRFSHRFETALAAPGGALPAMRIDQLAAHFHHLEKQLLTRWDAPLINDFFAMIYFGTLRKLTQKWCKDADATLHNGLLCGTGNIISAEPAKRIHQMAVIAAKSEPLVELLLAADLRAVLEGVVANGALDEQYRAYLDRFADRCLNELKLESPTLRDNPLPLLRSIGALARRMQHGHDSVGDGERTMQLTAEREVRQHLGGLRIVRRAIFGFVLRNARRRVRDRENLRFDRTRLFGRVREIFVEIGKRLHAMNAIDDARDVFHLEVHEVLGYIEGTASTTDLRALAAARRAEFARFAVMPPPADRFHTHGPVHIANDVIASPTPSSDADAVDGDSEALKGIGCCPGLVRGPVRVVHDPAGAALAPGEILVAEQTDPGWIMLFPAAAGVLVERGSLLSHSAIISREMGIPAIVSIQRLTHRLQTGDEVEFDGRTGVVRVLQRVAARTNE